MSYSCFFQEMLGIGAVYVSIIRNLHCQLGRDKLVALTGYRVTLIGDCLKEHFFFFSYDSI
jgi:hypothetical protein